MKLLVFAHTPPPHHGQSYMVQLMLAGFGTLGQSSEPSPYGINCYHVNARISDSLEDIGGFRIGKFFRLLGYCLQAIWIRYRYGVTNFYYVPAPGKRSAVYRDWMVMLICRPFFSRLFFHWHAAGLSGWLFSNSQRRLRSITIRLLKNVDLSIVLSQFNRPDAEFFSSQRILVINNGIPAPQASVAHDLARRQRARLTVRNKLFNHLTPTASELSQAGSSPHLIEVLFLAHCTREKGLFDAISGVMTANEKLAAKNIPLKFSLTVAGDFATAEERAEFDQILTQSAAAETIRLIGFVSNEQKSQTFQAADIFCFPTYYANENQPVNLLEAMAFGLPVVTTRWRSIPEMFPVAYPGLVDCHAPTQIADALIKLAIADWHDQLRSTFLNNFTLEKHLKALAEAIHSTAT